MTHAPIPPSTLDEIMAATGAAVWGVAPARPVDPQAIARRDRWIAQGNHAGMDYLTRYPEQRADPRELLPGARSIIVAAFPYTPARRQDPRALQIAWYAYGRDYHDVVRRRLTAVADRLTALHPSPEGTQVCRVCVDTAPIMERYWAVQAGLGFIGRNCQLIIPNQGSAFFLGEIVTTIPLTESKPCRLQCPDGCDRCIRACPGTAINTDSTLDARRCLSYLTIEHRGELPPDAPRPGRRLYGCDTCQTVCPFNRDAIPTTIPEFAPRQELLTLSPDDVASMTQEQFSTLFAGSAIKRAKLAGLKRNLDAILRQ